MEQNSVTIEHSSGGAKRKRTPISDSAPPPLSVVPNGLIVSQINYLVKDRPEKLKLIEGDAETFSDVLGMIDEYEGVLQRRESLAANLGAKLVAPLLFKSFEKLFDGPIKVLQTSFTLEQSPVSWIDVITFARTNPTEFVLVDLAPGLKACRFWFKGSQLEITEDDYRLIVSGAPERMIPTQPIAEDETAELATLNIIEARLAMLIKKADAVASKARQLNYHLKGRKTAFHNRRPADRSDSTERTLSPQSAPPRSPGPPGSGNVTKMQEQLLEQFVVNPSNSSSRRASIAPAQPKISHTIMFPDNVQTQGVNLVPSTSSSYNGFSASALPVDQFDRRPSQSNTATSSDDGIENHHRVVMATKIDKLAKGDVIFPPCDRCRRLKFDCIKHISACAGCTKKHARCSWKDVREGELEYNLPAQIQHSRSNAHQQADRTFLPTESASRDRLQLDTLGRSPISGASIPTIAEEYRAYHEAYPAKSGEERTFPQGMKVNTEESLMTRIQSGPT